VYVIKAKMEIIRGSSGDILTVAFFWFRMLRLGTTLKFCLEYM